MIGFKVSMRTFDLDSIATAFTDFLVRTLLKLAFPVSLLLSRFDWRPYNGALVIIRVKDEVLLLRSSYRREWNLPGGRVQAGEDPKSAALRELNEELGMNLEAILPAKVISGKWRGRRETVHFFESRLSALPNIRIDNREIVEWKLAPAAELDRWQMTDAVKEYFESVTCAPKLYAI